MRKSPRVQVRTEEIVIPTYLPHAPDKNPMFLEKRVYQGSSGRVYPLPCTDRISATKTDQVWRVVWLENQYLRVMILPEIGGRIHAILDKTNGYDLVYRQPVIKPALVGLAGPWISGGIEFNWPQHHRPATFLPVEIRIQEHADGSKTVWCGDHDPISRMTGMHGVCLHPDRAWVELKARVHNRTPFSQTFLWWVNLAARVHEGYQSFFPPSVQVVADHAKRALSAYPRCRGSYYGVDYARRRRQGVPASQRPSQFVPPHGRPPSAAPDPPSLIPQYAPDDLSFYANIPTPCSYMAVGSKENFFGGYDHRARAGIIHYADHHLAPGQKQWTWGNHEFGYAWDRHLTDPNEHGEFSPYIELMAGVYTDNQPDFSFLQPGETKTWSQYLYPIQQIGPAQQATLDAAVSMRRHTEAGRTAVWIGVSVTRALPKSAIALSATSALNTGSHRALPSRPQKIRPLAVFTADLAPGHPFLKKFLLPKKYQNADLQLLIADDHQRPLLRYAQEPRAPGPILRPAAEPPAPPDLSSIDELFLTGLHLEQYRHATRAPTLYWREALRRDPLDLRCNQALGLWHLQRGEFGQAETHLRRAIERATQRNPNPRDGEAHYTLGVCLRCQIELRDGFAAISADKSLAPSLARATESILEEACAAFSKATWNQAWISAGHHALAELDCRRHDWEAARDHLDRTLRANSDHAQARNLQVMVLRRLGRATEAAEVLRETLDLDPLDGWARHLAGERFQGDAQTSLDLSHDLARAGFYREAIDWLEGHVSTNALVGREARPGNCAMSPARPTPSWGASPMVFYTLGWLHAQAGQPQIAAERFRQGSRQPPDYCFPARLEEIAILRAAMQVDPNDARAPYYLGNLLYDRRRQEEATELWERSARLDSSYSVVWRNLGIAYFNVLKKPRKARAAYDQAWQANPADARLLYERDQLWKRLGVSPGKRRRELEAYPDHVRQRDDLSLELCALYNQTGQPEKSRRLLESRQFQPWEGGEGQALGEHVRTHLILGREALRQGRCDAAEFHFRRALNPPQNLGEARHVLASASDIHFWLGEALAALGQRSAARNHWTIAATFQGDFQEMSVRAFSEMTYYSALSWQRLGRNAKARRLLTDLLKDARKLQQTRATLDYFATSLPSMLLFEDDIQLRQANAALFLETQALLGLQNGTAARRTLKQVLRSDPNHARAADLLAELESMRA